MVVWCPGACCGRPTFADGWAKLTTREWKTVAFDIAAGNLVVPNGSIGFRWGRKKANGNPRIAGCGSGNEVDLFC